jgi:IclR family transcriptional regulator, KDG regulon repressor
MSTLDKGTRRVADALDLVAQSRITLSSKHIIDRLATPRSSGYDLLGGLDDRRFLKKRAGGNWILGDEIHALAMSRFGLGSVAAQVAPLLSTLQEETQETAQLAVLHDSNTLVTHVFSSLRSMHIVAEIGRVAPVNWSAAGRLLVSDLDDKGLLKFLSSHAKPLPSDGSRFDVEEFVREARNARRRGYALEIDAVQQGACSISSPVLDQRSRCVAAVSLMLPAVRMINSQDSLVSLVCGAASKLTHALASAA